MCDSLPNCQSFEWKASSGDGSATGAAWLKSESSPVTFTPYEGGNCLYTKLKGGVPLHIPALPTLPPPFSGCQDISGYLVHQLPSPGPYLPSDTQIISGGTLHNYSASSSHTFTAPQTATSICNDLGNMCASFLWACGIINPTSTFDYSFGYAWIFSKVANLYNTVSGPNMMMSCYGCQPICYYVKIMPPRPPSPPLPPSLPSPPSHPPYPPCPPPHPPLLPSPPTSPLHTSSSTGIGMGVIIGATIGGVFGILTIVGVAFWLLSHRHHEVR